MKTDVKKIIYGDLVETVNINNFIRQNLKM